VPAAPEPHPVRLLRTFPPDRHALGAGVRTCQLDPVAMEATGVCWIPSSAWLEPHGSTPSLGNAQPVQTLPGRTADGNAAPWRQQRPLVGRWPGSFRPDAESCKRRTLLRQRAQLIEQRAPPSLPRPPALQQLPLHLRVGLRDMMGTTAQAMLRAIGAGERDPVPLARLRHPGCHSAEELMATARPGTWQAAYLVVLTPARARSAGDTAPIARGDRPLAAPRRALAARAAGPPPAARPAPPTVQTPARQRPTWEARPAVVRLGGRARGADGRGRADDPSDCGGRWD
jgi:transposase